MTENSLASSSTSASVNWARSSLSSPLSTFLRSRTIPTSSSKISPDRSACETSSLCSSCRVLSARSSSAIEMMPATGVRVSWLM